MIGPQNGKSTILQPRPDDVLRCFVARRRAYTLSPVKARSVQVVSSEEKILGTGLGKDKLAGCLGLSNAQSRAWVTDVHEQDGRAGNERRECNGSISGFGLKHRWTRVWVIFGLDQIPRLQLVSQPVENVAILSVDHSQDMILPRLE